MATHAAPPRPACMGAAKDAPPEATASDTQAPSGGGADAAAGTASAAELARLRRAERELASTLLELSETDALLRASLDARARVAAEVARLRVALAPAVRRAVLDARAAAAGGGARCGSAQQAA